jgi:serine phosphatase RsbU (regulator of sigma subunit)
MFVVELILEIVKTNQEKSASEILQTLRSAIREFTGNAPQLDDLTAIVIKVN